MNLKEDIKNYAYKKLSLQEKNEWDERSRYFIDVLYSNFQFDVSHHVPNPNLFFYIIMQYCWKEPQILYKHENWSGKISHFDYKFIYFELDNDLKEWVNNYKYQVITRYKSKSEYHKFYEQYNGFMIQQYELKLFSHPDSIRNKRQCNNCFGYCK